MITLINEQERKFPVEWFLFHQIPSIIKDFSSCNATYESPPFLVPPRLSAAERRTIVSRGHRPQALAAPANSLNIGLRDTRKKALLLSSLTH